MPKIFLIKNRLEQLQLRLSQLNKGDTSEPLSEAGPLALIVRSESQGKYTRTVTLQAGTRIGAKRTVQARELGMRYPSVPEGFPRSSGRASVAVCDRVPRRGKNPFFGRPSCPKMAPCALGFVMSLNLSMFSTKREVLMLRLRSSPLLTLDDFFTDDVQASFESADNVSEFFLFPSSIGNNYN